MSISLEKRTFKLRKDEDYKVPSTGLIKSWRVVDKSLIPTLYLNDIKIDIPNRKDEYCVDIQEIREYIRNIECPFETEEILLINIERTLFTQQIDAIEYYSSLKNKDFFNSIFTKGLDVKLKFHHHGVDKDEGVDGVEKDESDEGVVEVDEVEIEEEYWNRKKIIVTV